MNTLKIILSIALMAASIFAHADREYKPEQLKKMVKDKKYPAQNLINEKKLFDISWIDCITRTEAIVNAVAPNYPVEKIVDTKIITTTKIWTNNGVITATCYGDGRMLLTQASYK